MKKLQILCVAFMLTIALHAQNNANDIIGKWLSQTGKAKIEVFESGNKYYGKIVWLKDPLNEEGTPKLDKNNPNPEKQKLKLIGLLLLRSMEFDGHDTWHNGTIYDPENGKEYKCKITKNAQDRKSTRLNSSH